MKKAAIWFFIGATTLAGNLALAQEVKSTTPKIGYTNVNYILSESPETKAITSQLEAAQKQYMKTIEDKSKELEEKTAAYQKAQSTMLESIRADKENELRNLYNSIKTLEQNASEDLKKRENELVKPELDKIYKAIEVVAKEKGFTHIFNSDQVLLYAIEDSDVTELVIEKLNYKKGGSAKPAESAPAPKPATPTPAGPKTIGGQKKPK
jgi:outer membrane protein